MSELDPHIPAALPFARARRQVERAMGIANYVIGFALTLGALVLAFRWRVRFGGFVGLRSFYLQAAWAFGALQLLAGVAMMRRWAARWVLQMLPLVVPVLAYQYFILHFIYRRL